MSVIIGRISQDWAKKAGLSYWYEDETTSTNDIAKDQALMEKESIRLFLTDYQSVGRGRGTNTWVTQNPGDAFLGSWSFLTRQAPQPVLSPMIGLALYRALQATFPALPFSLKAPNDIFLEDKKVAGVLLENISMGERNRLIVGIGINFYSAPDLDTAASLIDFAGEIGALDIAQTLDRMLLEITMAISSTGSTLTASQQESLLYVLNLNPLLTAPYSEVTAFGDLVTGHHTTKWSEL